MTRACPDVQENRMRVGNILSIGLLAVSRSSIGCGGATEERTSPTAPTPEQNAGSSEGVTRPPQPPRPDPPPATGTCVAEKAQGAIGQPATAALLERARVAATASVARFIRPNEAITLEYSGARLNLSLDERDIVRGVHCG
jgi:hypothetical protein